MVTEGFHSQQAGFLPIAGLLLLGFVGMGFVRDPSRMRRPAD
jgi:MFS-type transporter involved in bile tolerance (Atg22 family)